MDSIKIYIQNQDLTFNTLEIPLGIELSLMEVLKGEGYEIEATCGGMALCATCRVQVLNAEELNIKVACDDELAMLENLPCYTGNCRLSCQIRISESMDGLMIKFPEESIVF
jgi:2Fe-2S ferredoxin